MQGDGRVQVDGRDRQSGQGAGATGKGTGAGLGVEAGMMWDGALMARTGAGTGALIKCNQIVFFVCVCVCGLLPHLLGVPYPIPFLSRQK